LQPLARLAFGRGDTSRKIGCGTFGVIVPMPNARAIVFALAVGNFVDTLVFTKFSAQDSPLRLSDHRYSRRIQNKT
jgi:hypothetical protein